MSTTGVMATIGVIVASTESKKLIEKKSLTMRPVIAGFLLGIFLFPLDSARPDLAKQFQVLLVVGALLVNGSDLLQLFIKATNSAKA